MELRVSWIQIEDEKGAQEMGKEPGSYLTLEGPGLEIRRTLNCKTGLPLTFPGNSTLFRELKVGPRKNAQVLIVVWVIANVTADALGPFVVKHTMVTRHLFELFPEQVDEGYRSVSAISPGVLGTTGIETSEIVLDSGKDSAPIW